MLEGGGQILRNAAALAAITGQPLRVSKIRAGRSKPGLRPQHLAGLQLVARIASAQLTGAAVGSSTIVLESGALCGGHHAADPGTAGSCVLLAQVAAAFLHPLAHPETSWSPESLTCGARSVATGLWRFWGCVNGCQCAVAV